jgi:hypothetical protein
MSPTALRAVGLIGTLGYAAFIVWVYWTRPQSLTEMSGGMASAVGLYEVDRAQLAQGRRFLHDGRYPEARAAFGRADPALRDAQTQFYVAYSFYRQGWGRFYSDNTLFRAALVTLDRATALAPGGRIQVNDPELGLADSDALRAELERGLVLEAEDFNPLRVFRSPK